MEAFQKVGVFIAFGIAWNSWINGIYEQRKRLVHCSSFFDNWWFLQFLAEFCTVLQCVKYACRRSVITLASSVKVVAKESLSIDNKGLSASTHCSKSQSLCNGKSQQSVSPTYPGLQWQRCASAAEQDLQCDNSSCIIQSCYLSAPNLAH